MIFRLNRLPRLLLDLQAAVTFRAAHILGGNEREDEEMIPEQEIPRSGLFVFITASILQAFHIVEHIAQIYQHLILGLSISESHGIIFFLDLEWNHFVFDALVYFSLLAFVFWRCKFYRLGNKSAILFSVGLGIQTYHAFEHTVRMIQYYQTGCTPCLGVMGNFFDLVYLHGFLNLIVYILTLVGFLGVYKRLVARSSTRSP